MILLNNRPKCQEHLYVYQGPELGLTHTLFWVGAEGGGLFFLDLRGGSEGGDRV